MQVNVRGVQNMLGGGGARMKLGGGGCAPPEKIRQWNYYSKYIQKQSKECNFGLSRGRRNHRMVGG